MTRAWPGRSASWSVSMVAIAAAHWSGPPPNVVPCMPASSDSATRADIAAAPIGKPPAIPLASVIMSGSRPSSACANQAPVRPKPVWISSTMKSAPRSRHSSCARRRKAGSIGHTPLSPWITSAMKAEVSAPIARSRPSRSPGSTNVAVWSRGANVSRKLGFQVVASAPSVRPWKLRLSATQPRRRLARNANLSAASLASVPLLQRKKCAKCSGSRARSSASSSARRSLKKFDDSAISLPACALMAASSAGCAWPSGATP